MAKSDRKKKKKKGKKKDRKFWYKKASKEEVNRWSKESGGMYDQLIGDDYSIFTPKEDDYTIRILPPSFGDRKRYGLETYIHYSVGADRQKYLCNKNMKQGECPICEERDKANADGESDYASKLTSRKRFACWIIDRDDEDAGPLVWLMPYTVDKELNKLRQDKRSKEVLDIVDPDEGYDFTFSKEGTALNTKYTGMRISHDDSPIFDDASATEEVLEFIENNPVNEALNFFEYEHIDNVFAGGAGMNTDDNDDDEDDKKKKKKKKKSDNKKKKSRRKKEYDEDENDDDEDDESSDDDDVDDEDDEDDEDDDEDDDDEDEDKEDDDDSDDEDDDDEEDDDDDEDDDDSEDDDDDQDDDDDEVEETKTKRKKKKKAKGKDKDNKSTKSKIDKMRKKKKKRK